MKKNIIYVLHVRNEEEYNIWFNKVKHFKFHGWAVSVNSIYDILFTLKILLNEDKDSNTKLQYIHYLGVYKPKTIILLYIIQQILNLHNINVIITTDNSIPSRIITQNIQLISFNEIKFDFNFKVNINKQYLIEQNIKVYLDFINNINHYSDLLLNTEYNLLYSIIIDVIKNPKNLIDYKEYLLLLN